jgi:hypothetical protein
LLLRRFRRDEVLDDVDQTLDLHMCSSTPHGIRRQVVCELGALVGMKKEAVINQQAQDHAAACAFGARLLGQWAPAFMRLPVLHEHFDEPSQGMPLDHIERAPSQVRGHQIAVSLFAFVCDRHDEPVGVVGTDVQPCPADESNDLFSPTDADGAGRPGMGGQRIGDVLLVLIPADVLRTAYLRDDLHAPKQRRGPSDKGCGPLEGIRRDTVHPEGGMLCFALLQ